MIEIILEGLITGLWPGPDLAKYQIDSRGVMVKNLHRVHDLRFRCRRWMLSE